ncbi:HAD family hydrolase [Herbaspirillum sp. GCM10030257]|uniref:HAD family hydrolase n=1 Tax=Herbaspirillum sp. GCM10030257 TaxID=3273393 RepID=UPI003620F997
MVTKLIIFDLDETLVHATMNKLSYAPDFEVSPYVVYIRPFAAELLEFTATHFDIAIWSSSSAVYVEAVTERLFRPLYLPRFSWAVEKCVQKVDPRTNGYVYIKDLRWVRKHGYDVDEIIIIDDSPEKIQRQPRSHLHVAPFTESPSDQEPLACDSSAERITRPDQRLN